MRLRGGGGDSSIVFVEIFFAGYKMESNFDMNMSDDGFVSHVKMSLPGTLLDIHDISSKRRRNARLVLRRMCERTNTSPHLQEFLVSATVACLAGASETIRASVVESLGLFAYVMEECEALKDRFIKVILLLDVSSPQMARSLLKFVRLSIQGSSNPETIEKCFQFFVKSILGSAVARSACRVRMRTLIEKLGKKFGWNDLEKRIPEEHIKLFRYTRRMYNRRVRKAVERDNKADGLPESDDEDLSDDDDRVDPTAAEIVMVENATETPIDLLSGKLQFARKRQLATSGSGPLKMSADGRILVEDDDKKMTPTKTPAVSLSDLAELRDRFNALKKAKNAEKAAASLSLGKSGSGRRTTRSEQITQRNRRKHELVGLSQYAPKKANAFGDSKRSEQDTDPFAYIRLNPSLIREKYKGNAIGSLSRVIKKTGEKSSSTAAAAKRFTAKSRHGRSGIDGSLFVHKPERKAGGGNSKRRPLTPIIQKKRK